MRAETLRAAAAEATARAATSALAAQQAIAIAAYNRSPLLLPSCSRITELSDTSEIDSDNEDDGDSSLLESPEASQQRQQQRIGMLRDTSSSIPLQPSLHVTEQYSEHRVQPVRPENFPMGVIQNACTQLHAPPSPQPFTSPSLDVFMALNLAMATVDSYEPPPTARAQAAPTGAPKPPIPPPDLDVLMSEAYHRGQRDPRGK